MPFDTPILFLIFNRPDTTQKVFEQIRNIQPKQLFVAADGPRINKPGEAEQCQLTKNIVINNIDWDCEVKTLSRNENLGCGKAVSEAISWFFDNVEQGIILEDDCLPDPSFFPFCEELLDYYKDDVRVWTISGVNFQDGNWRGEGSYYFSFMTHVWGWASWKDRWQKYQFDFTDLTREEIKYYTSNRKVIDTYLNTSQKLKEIDTWDYQLLFTMWRNKAFSVIPNSNLISNIGFGEGATHTTENSTFADNELSQIADIWHAKDVIVNSEADNYFILKQFRDKPPMYRRILNKLIRLLG